MLFESVLETQVMKPRISISIKNGTFKHFQTVIYNLNSRFQKTEVRSCKLNFLNRILFTEVLTGILIINLNSPLRIIIATFREISLLNAEFGSSKNNLKKIRGAHSRHVFVYSTVQERMILELLF